LIKELLNTFSKAFKTLHEFQSYKISDLQNVPEYKNAILDTFDILKQSVSEGIKDNTISGTLKTALLSDVFLFSALRTHAQLFEASRLLKTASGGIKPFNQFAQDIASINKNYNENYLQAEYQFATASALMAQKWSDIEENNDRYNLQYRTAGDEKVRASHQALDMITLPASDTFWNTYYPPNGWRCRCNTIEVLKDKYEVSNSEEAIKAGEKATTQLDKNGKNKLEIFRFNPGKQKVIFPPKHPYRKLQGAVGVVKKFEQGYKQSVYAKPLNEQYSSIFSVKNGGYVQVHELVNFKAEDYNDVINVAKAFAKEGKKVSVLPEIYKSEIDARNKIFKGLSNKSSNPDLMVNNQLMDVKRPESFKKITPNANKASSQNSIAVISDKSLKFNEKTAKERAEAIFKDKNKSNYQFDDVYFYTDGKLIKYKRQ
jgi:SPP1 gp7 family putative phage head morphogenesis protein